MKNQNNHVCRRTANGNLLVHCDNTYFFVHPKSGKFIDMATSQLWGFAKSWDSPKVAIPAEILPQVKQIAEDIKAMTKLADAKLTDGDMVSVVFDQLCYRRVKEENAELLMLSPFAPADEEGWKKQKAWTCIYVAQPDPTRFGFIVIDPLQSEKAVSVPIEKIKLVGVVKKQTNAQAA